MAVTPRLELRQRTGLALTPAMRRALSILRMPPGELDAALARAVARNPFLLPAPAPSGPLPNQLDAPRPAETETMAARAPSFQDALLHQLALIGLQEPTASLARLLIGELREDGFLDTPLDELTSAWHVPAEMLDEALAALQQCEPPGIAARDLGECLRLQLAALGLTPAEAAETVRHLDLFARADWAALARRLGLGAREARARTALLKRLSPRPVVPGETEAVALPAPDLIAERDRDGAVSIRLVRDAGPRVMLDDSLVRRAQQEGFASDLLADARALIAALDQRGRTLGRIGAWLAQHQAGFFLHGPQAMRPATRAALAAELDMHPSTIGRAIAGKTIDVEGRLWPLERFFSRALGEGDEAVAAFTIQQRIKAMIASEPAQAPLSDDALAQALRAEGVDIARRTVAKYRQGLRIPNSAARRRQAVSARRGQPGRAAED